MTKVTAQARRHWTQWGRITHWPHPFFIHYRTLEGKAADPFTSALRPLHHQGQQKSFFSRNPTV